ncbi:DUF4260 domain-containing protein [Lysinibacillus sp. SGAir0095]|uniref:DUF4260 domain-containing protein n=1 Tax=Lysinibacillus sp. SGAir0095 TaxID=2070463 RepID=UPI0010CCB34F|nr:DUF4260 domain-containing protein [Lysinibacillus sp. SGAir0095]QCR31122.1 DUF4260 domain-containing protein [Lysinibacillus sp. SGAir0095]
MSLRKYIYFEYAIGFIICLLLYIHLEYSILLFILFLLVPDITMVGYLMNPKIGSIFYNLGHSLIIPYTLFIIAFLTDSSSLLMIVIIWLAHIYMDRSIGFGLKYSNAFKHTHLQKID